MQAYEIKIYIMEESSLRITVGKRISRLREEAKFGKAAFCLTAGLSRPHLDHIEAGTVSPTLDMLERIAKALGVSVADLVREEDDEDDAPSEP